MFRLKHRPHYFSKHVDREVSEVYWHTIISSLALSLVFIFEPIYLYSIGYSLVQILWFYVLIYVGYILFLYSGAGFASRFGYKHSILISNIFYIAYWFALFYIQKFPGLFFVAPFLHAMQKSLFWPSYHSDISVASLKSQRGREVGVLFALVQTSFIIGPFLGGLVSEQFGFLTLFVLAGVLMFVSAYPLFRSPEVHTKRHFKLKNFIQVFKMHKQNFFGYWGFAEDFMLQSIWPIYIFIVVPSFFEVGAITTIATLIGTVIMLYVGKLTDRRGERGLIKLSSIFYGLTWIFRFLARSLTSVLVFDALTKTGKDILNVPMTALTYRRSGTNPDHAIAYSVFFEFSLSVAKILTALSGILILALTGNIFWIFALAGVLTFMYSLLR